MFSRLEKKAEALPSAGAAPRPGLDAARTAIDSIAHARTDKQRDCEPFFAVGADGEESFVPNEAEGWSKRKAGYCGFVQAARIFGVRDGKR